ncbi:MAG: hypothetical protein HN742_18840 [Lentisphaerae bacterium]|jgi:hypothetical protein|nr:hypothetical protein [Lentisphaerota bacterium]MBT4821958.1 hypothetical protein [Lentisphaerota bacterium]MBT5605762.1 hypothetical protein [Lentisphaerota bacterium]MBT7053915.1 hypothetical protein [Lentisphaerota bacterium]MBT7843943.1 hypothetical protein [Lentisphaerota bacterium]
MPKLPTIHKLTLVFGILTASALWLPAQPAPELPELLKTLESGTDEAAYHAIDALTARHAHALEAVPLLVQRLTGEEPSLALRCAAAHALGVAHPETPDVVTALADALRSGNERLRCTAAWALTAIGEPARPALTAALLGPNKTLRLTVANALRGSADSTFNDLLEWASPAVALLGPSLLPNGGFEAHHKELTGWSVNPCRDATGVASIDDTTARTGRRSLRLTKTNGLGYLDIRSTHPVVIPPGRKTWTYAVHFRADDAPVSSALYLRFEDEKGNLIGDDTGLNRAAGWQSQSLLRNTPPGKWDKRLIMRRQSKEEQRLYVHIILYGNPCTVWIDDVTFPSPEWKPAATGPTMTQPRHTRSEALAVLAQRPDARAIVRKGARNSELIVDGKPAAPVLHLGVSPLHADFHLFETQGNVPLQVLNIFLDSRKGTYIPNRPNWPGEAPVWRVGGETDFTTPMALVEGFARRAPNSYLILGFQVSWPEDYVTRNPETVWLDKDGRKGCGAATHFLGFKEELPRGTRWWPSPYSRKARQDAADVIRAFVRELKTTPYIKMVAGTFISGGHDGQFYIGWPDYSEPGVLGWREWLRRRYGSDEALAKAWRTPGATLANAQVPLSDSEAPPPPGGTLMFHDPRSRTPHSDYDEFMNQSIWEIEDYFAGVVKDEIGKDIIGLTWHMGGGWKGDFRAFLGSRALDAFISQPFYEFRYPGHSGGINCPYESIALHGKLAIKEMDTRSWLRGISNELITMRIGTPLSRDHFQAMNRKETGQMIARGQGYWYYDISGSTYRHPAAMEEIRTTKGVAEHVAANPRPFRPDVALVYHTPSFFCRRKTLYGLYNVATYAMKWQHMTLNTAGVPTHGYFLRDLMQQPELCRYKVYVFVNAFYLTEAERTFIGTLKQNGNVLLWHYAPGYVSPAGVSPDTISELIGMGVQTTPALTAQPTVVGPSGDPLARDLPPLQGMGDVFRSFFTLASTPLAHIDAQRFWVEDDDATVLARYASDNKVAIAVKRHPDWTSVYVASVAGIGAQLFHNVAREADAYVVTEPGPEVHMNGSFISLHGVRGGEIRLRLPRKCDVSDAFTGRIIARGAPETTLSLPAQATRWLLLE